MNSDQKRIRLAGGLILFQLTAAIISHSVILEPVLYGSKDFLVEVSNHSTAVRFSIILDFLVGAAWFGASVIFFPILKQYSERIALWFCGIRLAEFVTLMITGMLLFALLSTGQKYIQPTESAPSNLLDLGSIIRYTRGSTQNISLLAYSLGSALFYYLMFVSRLIPRVLSVLGFLGITGLLIEILMSMFGYSTAGFMYLIMLPMGLAEILLGLWLLVKGFNLTLAQP